MPSVSTDAWHRFRQGGCMEIHQLKYFICVAKLESISKAATTLHLSQPALSKSIAKLEDELGVLLFDRRGSAFI